MSDKIRETRTAAFAACPDTGCDWSSFWRGWQAALAQQPATAFPADVRALLEELAQYAPPEGVIVAPTAAMAMGRKAKRMLAAAPAAPVAQEPVAWRVSDPNEPEIGFWLSEEPGTSWHRSEPLYTAPPAAEQPHQLEQFTDACGRLHSACNKVREKLADMEAAEQPDTVAVPRELLEELADIADAMQCHDARDDAIALLGKEGEA